MLRPFFGYFGGKWRLAHHYPRPQHPTIIEPFAGSAGYSLHYADRQVILVEKNPVIVGVWRYLISGDPRRVRMLPDTPDATLLPAERALMGLWFAKAPTAPRNAPSAWARDPQYRGSSWWGPRIRDRIADQMPAIRHWVVLQADYSHAPVTSATWFIDPPYLNAGRVYPCGSKDIDYQRLGAWCRQLPGQVLVCEAADANWLPFSALPGTQARLRKTSKHKEALWMKTCC